MSTGVFVALPWSLSYGQIPTQMIYVDTLHKQVKDICRYLDLNAKIKVNSRNSTNHLENFKIS